MDRAKTPQSNINLFDPMPSDDQEADDYGNKIVISNVENLEDASEEEENNLENLDMGDLEVRDDLSN